MRASAVSAVRTGLRSAGMAVAVRVLPLTQYTPVSKWLAFSLVTFEHLEGEGF